MNLLKTLKNMEELSSKGDKIINKDKLSLKDDIIFFKEELLKYMNILEKSFSQQKKEIQSDINGKFILYFIFNILYY